MTSVKAFDTVRALCGICAIRYVEAKGRCHVCRTYLTRFGNDRPVELTDGERIGLAMTLGNYRPGPKLCADGTVLHLAPHPPVAVVYFLQRECDRMVKIGTTKSLPQRIDSLRTATGPLNLLLVEVGARAREQELHRAFSKSRQHGEWFRPTDDLIDYVNVHRPQSRRLLALRP